MTIRSAGFATIKAYQADLLRGFAIPAAGAQTTAGATLLDLTNSLSSYKNRIAGANISEPLINDQAGPGERIASPLEKSERKAS